MSSARPASLALLLVASLGGATGCVVLKKDYDKSVADAAQAKAAADADHKSEEARIADLQQQLAQVQGQLQDTETRLTDLTTSSHNMQAQLDEATAINQQLRGELERLGKDADKLLADKGTLSKALDDAKSRLDELRKAQAAAEARTELFHDLAYRFKSLIDAGQLRIDNRRGELVVNVNGDLLFDAGHAEIRTVGKGVLMELAHALQQLPPPPAGQGSSPRRFLVTSHVDDAPFKSKHYRSTWELTAARAAAAVEYLVSIGIPAESLTAAGAGSFDPVVPNDSADDRAKNRRLELALLPSAPPAAPAPASAPPAAPSPPPLPAPAAVPAPAKPSAKK